jgi:hypothetical protein
MHKGELANINPPRITTEPYLCDHSHILLKQYTIEIKNFIMKQIVKEKSTKKSLKNSYKLDTNKLRRSDSDILKHF